jgi:hypothetical protein
VSHSEVDNSGYDVIVEANGVSRHIQLKAMRIGGGRKSFDLQLRLGDKPSGCAILMLHEPRSLAVTGYRWFGGLPGQKLPLLGSKLTRHTRGSKAERPALREVPIGSFEAVDGVGALVDRMFGAVDLL